VLPPYELIGGLVTISVDDPNVYLVAATPKAGFSVEIDKVGPEEVRVEFESSDRESSFRARWKDGELDIDIDEESEEDD
jgi:polyisoprenoid-binding protein YceI